MITASNPTGPVKLGIEPLQEGTVNVGWGTGFMGGPALTKPSPVGFVQQLVNSHMVSNGSHTKQTSSNSHGSMVFVSCLPLQTMTKQPWFLPRLLVSPRTAHGWTTAQLRCHGTDVAQGICRAGLASAAWGSSSELGDPAGRVPWFIFWVRGSP